MVDQPYAQGCRHTIIAGFGKLPPLVCLLGQTIPASFDYMHILVRTHMVHPLVQISQGPTLATKWETLAEALDLPDEMRQNLSFFSNCLFQFSIKNILNNTMCNY